MVNNLLEINANHNTIYMAEIQAFFAIFAEICCFYQPKVTYLSLGAAAGSTETCMRATIS